MKKEILLVALFWIVFTISPVFALTYVSMYDNDTVAETNPQAGDMVRSYMILIGSVSAQSAISFISTYDGDDSPMTNLEPVSGIFEKILYSIDNISENGGCEDGSL